MTTEEEKLEAGVTQPEEETQPSFPTEKWFEEEELDKEIHDIRYRMNGQPKTVSFLYAAISEDESKVMRAKCEKDDSDLGRIVDTSAFNDQVLLNTVFTDANGKCPLTERQLKAIKANKKTGMYQEMVLLSQRMSGTDSIFETIENEKK